MNYGVPMQRFGCPPTADHQTDNGGLSSTLLLPPPDSNNTKPLTTTTTTNGDQQQLPNNKHILHWFRRGLRLHDNPALVQALKSRDGQPAASSLRFVYILDQWFAGRSEASFNKWRFLLQSLEDLDLSLRKLDTRLYLVRGQPTELLPKLMQKWRVTHLSFEEHPEPYGRQLDAAVVALSKDMGVNVVRATSHTLYSPQAVIRANCDRVPLTYKTFQAVIETLGSPEAPCEPINSCQLAGVELPHSDNHDDVYGIPKLEELSFDLSKAPRMDLWRGGESEALLRLERHIERKAYVASFDSPKFNSRSLFANTQTGLSPYLTFGCLSPRLFYWRLTDLYRKVKKQPHVRPPISLFGQLLWREFFYTVSSENKHFDRMVDNPLCVQIPWDRNPKALAKWAEGKTGFPWIDAIMRQLKQQGWIHPLCRHSVACFLTRGALFLPWEDGQMVFEELMLDADWSTNAGNWLWISESSFFHKFFRTLCPVNFGKKLDPSGDFVKHYIPELKGYPAQYIYEPWLAPEALQRSVRCVIGRDYPLPMVDHVLMSRQNAARIRRIYCRIFANIQSAMKNYTSVPLPLAVDRQQTHDEAQSQWQKKIQSRSALLAPPTPPSTTPQQQHQTHHKQLLQSATTASGPPAHLVTSHHKPGPSPAGATTSVTVNFARLFSSSSSDDQDSLGKTNRSTASSRRKQLIASIEEVYTST